MAKDYFHKITVNHILLAVSFENKTNTYYQRSIKLLSYRTNVKGEAEVCACKRELSIMVNLLCEYCIEAVYYYGEALTGLELAIPSKMKFRKKQKQNKTFCAYIGMEYIGSNISLLISSMKRMQNLASDIEKLYCDLMSVGIELDAFENLNSFFSDVVRYIDQIDQVKQRAIGYLARRATR